MDIPVKIALLAKFKINLIQRFVQHPNAQVSNKFNYPQTQKHVGDVKIAIGQDNSQMNQSLPVEKDLKQLVETVLRSNQMMVILVRNVQQVKSKTRIIKRFAN